MMYLIPWEQTSPTTWVVRCLKNRNISVARIDFNIDVWVGKIAYYAGAEVTNSLVLFQAMSFKKYTIDKDMRVVKDRINNELERRKCRFVDSKLGSMV